MASRYDSSSSSDTIVNPTNPTSSSGSSSNSSQQSSSSTSFSGITDQNALAALQQLISQLASGGTDADKATATERKQTIDETRAAAGNYTKDKAFADAADLISQSLQSSLEKNMPAISKSIQSAGTSASSMQGLLSQKLATDSAQAAGALGAQQAVSYGGISAQLANVLENLTKSDPANTTALINALGLLKNTSSSSTSQGTSVGSSVQQSSGGGGGGTSKVSQSRGSSEVYPSQTLTGQAYWDAQDALASNSSSGLMTYEVPSGGNLWANYTGEGNYQGTSTSLPSGYMDVQNTTDYDNYYD